MKVKTKWGIKIDFKQTFNPKQLEDKNVLTSILDSVAILNIQA
jgi:hypothetical protein